MTGLRGGRGGRLQRAHLLFDQHPILLLRPSCATAVELEPFRYLCGTPVWGSDCGLRVSPSAELSPSTCSLLLRRLLSLELRLVAELLFLPERLLPFALFGFRAPRLGIVVLALAFVGLFGLVYPLAVHDHRLDGDGRVAILVDVLFFVVDRKDRGVVG